MARSDQDQKAVDWGRARRLVNDAVRSRAARMLGDSFVERLVERRVEASLAAWLEPYLSGRVRPVPGAEARESESDLVSRLRGRIAHPALMLGAGTGAVAAALGVTAALEPEGWRLEIARETFPAIDFRGCELAEVDATFQTIVVLLALDGSGRREPVPSFRELIPAVSARLRPGGRLYLVDLQAYQDDAVSQLAALDYEIDDIWQLASSEAVMIAAARLEPE